MTVLVITTGGTIGAEPYPDPKHPPQISTMPPAGTDYVQAALAGDFADIASHCVALEPRDSALIDKVYRDGISAVIADAAETEIVITHGTVTLLATAEYFFAKKPPGKTIILTGAMMPLSNGAESDGYLNLRFSLRQLADKELQPGVYVVLCNFDDAKNRRGWSPRLYAFAPGMYEKVNDLQDGRFSRICRLKPAAV